MLSTIGIFLGTRPEIIKMAPVIWELKEHASQAVLVIHTGQHYDWEMSERFFHELDVPEPDEFLGVGSGTQGRQLSKIVTSSEACLIKKRIRLAVVEGDTNSALGVALASSKIGVPLAHVEAGCRSFDRTMPEEINRILISDCADLNLAPTLNCVKNLQNEGIPNHQIFLTGHPIVTLLHAARARIERSEVLSRMHLRRRRYVLATTHRQENVDDAQRLRMILKGLGSLPTTVVVPVHPRTEKNVRKFKLSALLNTLRTFPPLGYFETLRLIRDAEAVITDSGGIQQEAFLLGTPCLTIRTTTEWPETVVKGGNILVDPRNISETFTRVHKDHGRIAKSIRLAGNIFGNIDAAAHISQILLKPPTKSALRIKARASRIS